MVVLRQIVSVLRQGGKGGTEPVCTRRVCYPFGLTRVSGELHGLMGLCRVFPSPLQPEEHWARGVACVGTEEGLQTTYTP